MKVGDIICIAALYEGVWPVKIIGETKNYYKVSLKNLPKGHSARTYEKDWNSEVSLYHKVTGIKKGCGDAESLKYCPPYILPLDDAIKSIKKDLKEYSDSHGLGTYIEDRKKELAACMKAKKEGIPA